ncbi:hypothetical protein [Streptomyces huiliensis]|uniref:hypothetical protein n=1 Tax=Streptomyces huiliensis TaxID=2876027 RepID=UPI001CBEADE1|nr:hypothetical protein [Streptomyces huiliensis]MBZ4323565.1 hypothetical protein [Streptomyces huiliensis]
MPGTHFSPRLAESEISAMVEGALAGLAHRLAHRSFRLLPAAGGPADPDGARAEALAYLHMLVHLERAVQRLTDAAAEEAARNGAGYPQIGRACEMSRQGARNRWPGIVHGTTHRPPKHTERSR